TRCETVIVDDLAHVLQDLGGARNRCARPRLEAIAEGVGVAVGADAGIAMRNPGATESPLAFEHDKARAGTLLCQMICCADPGDAGADDQHVEMLDLRRGRQSEAGIGHHCIGHRVRPFSSPDNLPYLGRRWDRRRAGPTGCASQSGMQDSVDGRRPGFAAMRGIKDGDIVRLYNERGACLAGAVLSEVLRPGTVQLSTGAWYDPRDSTAERPFCVQGNPNVLTCDVGTSRLAQGCTGQLCLVEIERFDGLLPPIKLPTRHPAGRELWRSR